MRFQYELCWRWWAPKLTSARTQRKRITKGGGLQPYIYSCNKPIFTRLAWGLHLAQQSFLGYWGHGGNAVDNICLCPHDASLRSSVSSSSAVRDLCTCTLCLERAGLGGIDASGRWLDLGHAVRHVKHCPGVLKSNLGFRADMHMRRAYACAHRASATTATVLLDASSQTAGFH